MSLQNYSQVRGSKGRGERPAARGTPGPGRAARALERGLGRPAAPRTAIPTLPVCFSTLSELAFLSPWKGKKGKKKRSGAIILRCWEWKLQHSRPQSLPRAGWDPERRGAAVAHPLVLPLATRAGAQPPRSPGFWTGCLGKPRGSAASPAPDGRHASRRRRCPLPRRRPLYASALRTALPRGGTPIAFQNLCLFRWINVIPNESELGRKPDKSLIL